MSLDEKVNVNEIVPGGARLFYNKSFFMYVGSESRPPCTEGVFRFVFKTPIKVRQSQLEAMRRGAYNLGVDFNGNNR